MTRPHPYWCDACRLDITNYTILTGSYKTIDEFFLSLFPQRPYAPQDPNIDTAQPSCSRYCLYFDKVIEVNEKRKYRIIQCRKGGNVKDHRHRLPLEGQGQCNCYVPKGVIIDPREVGAIATLPGLTEDQWNEAIGP